MLKTRCISVFVDLAEFLQPGEHRRHGPAAAVDRGGDARGQDAGQVFVQSAAGDVGDAVDHALYLVVREHAADGPGVDRRRPQEDFADGRAARFDAIVDFEPGDVEHDLSHQAVAVGVDAVRGDAEHDVAGRDRRAVEHLGFFDDADAEAGQVVVAAA